MKRLFTTFLLALLLAVQPVFSLDRSIVPVFKAVSSAALFTSSSGPNYPGTATDTNAFTDAFTNPNNIKVDDSSYATVAYSSGFGHHAGYLEGTNFGFSIPGDQVIKGVVFEFKCYDQVGGSYGSAYEEETKIVKGGTVGGTNKAITTYPTNTEQYYSRGSSSDLWGNTLTPSDVNASNFGVAMKWGMANDNVSFGTLYINAYRVTIYYAAPQKAHFYFEVWDEYESWFLIPGQSKLEARGN